MNAVSLALAKNFNPADFDPARCLSGIGCAETLARNMEVSVRRASALFAAARCPELSGFPEIRDRLLLLADYASWGIRSWAHHGSGFRLSSPDGILRALEAAVAVCSDLPFDHPARTAVENAD